MHSVWEQLIHQDVARHALIAGGVAAVVCGLVGYFAVLRGLAFATDAVTHVGFTGASGAVLLGITPIAGLLAGCMLMAACLGALEDGLRSRDVIVGMVLVQALGLGILFLSLYSGYSNTTYALLFGDILALSARDVGVIAVAAAVSLVALAGLYRPLLFASLDEELAEARGVPTRLVATGFLLVLAVAAAAATQVVGALLAVALLVAPAATAQRLTSRPSVALPLAAGFGLALMWVGIGMAFWKPYPVGFFVTSLAALLYMSVRAATGDRARRMWRAAADSGPDV